MPDDAAIEQRLDRVELLVARHLWIDSMQLPQANLLDPESMAAGIRLLDQIFRPSQRCPAIRSGPGEARLGGNEDVPIWVQRLTDQFLGDVGAVRVGGVDEIDVEF